MFVFSIKCTILDFNVSIILQPVTHFFLGNMLSAKGNMSGAIWHYEEALNQDSLHTDAFNTLRIIKCYQKFHRSTQSVAPKVETLPTVASNCHKTSPVLKSPLESRVVCKNVSIELTCICTNSSLNLDLWHFEASYKD